MYDVEGSYEDAVHINVRMSGLQSMDMNVEKREREREKAREQQEEGVCVCVCMHQPELDVHACQTRSSS